jgi:poly(3-hydroxybutyrate) depolymerase
VNRESSSALTFPPTIAGHVIGSAIDAWSAAAVGATDYWTGALNRGATPFDVFDDAVGWWHEMTDRKKPTWSSPNEVLLESGIAALRDFSQGSRKQVVPTLVLPPQAGHHSCIVDYSRDQSQIDTIRATGLERVYSLEWIGATAETKHSGILDYLRFVEESIDAIGGGPVNLIGDCQGGWLAAIYAALHPEQVNTLTLAGAPIDFHAGQGVIHEWVKLLCSTGDMSLYEGLVASGGGVMEGSRILDGFVLIKPDNEIAKQLDLLGHMDDPKHRERYRAFEDWFKWTQDLPGDFYLWIVAELFRDNKLISGELEVGGERVDMAKLKMPLYLLAGATDHITPPPQVFAARDAVSTPKSKVVERTTSGGHLGLFMGREALREHWPPILADVLTHSRKQASKPQARKKARASTPTRGRRTIPAP